MTIRGLGWLDAALHVVVGVVILIVATCGGVAWTSVHKSTTATTLTAISYDDPPKLSSVTNFPLARLNGINASTGGVGLARGEAVFVAAEEATVTASTIGRDAATSCLNSFTGDTPVTLADGKQEPISQVKVGDKVLATDPETGEFKAEPVVQLIRHSGEHSMVLVTLADGSVLDSTDGHPIWDATTGQFTDAGKLHAGDKIETSNGAFITIAGLTTYSADVTAYNLQIGTIHTYYAGATPVLVHNSCGERQVDAFLERTGKVHGNLPSVGELSQYNREELEILRGQLSASIQTRIAKTVQLGADYGHNARLAQEQGLLQSLDSYLGG